MKSKNLLITIVSLGIILFSVGIAMAAVSGLCVDCHTMHWSQDGTTPTSAYHGGTTIGLAGPYGALLVNDCIGCHTQTGTDTLGGSSDEIPIVYNIAEPTYGNDGTDGDTLAGGNFHWVAVVGDPAKGHNVPTITAADTIAPPGYDSGRPDKDGEIPGNGIWAAGTQVTCAGLYGCHGQHRDTDTNDWSSIRGGHHENDDCLKSGTYDTALAGTTVGKSYRFLYGIVGLEDSDWEFQPALGAHNQYKGIHRIDDAIASTDTSTISYLCSECHGQFHNDTGAGAIGDASPWLRHPTDFDMGAASGSEYVYYNGDDGTGTASYSVVAPVGLETFVDTQTVVDSVHVASSAQDAIVLCISCHRAHGTPWDDLLRWNYVEAGSVMSAGSGAGNVGCFICHTTKD
jgi:cytochrome c553